jgi:hypothetical protein
MNTKCKVCGFDANAYPVTIMVDGNAHIFHCPVCGQSFEPVIELEGKDVFYDREARSFFKWATPAESAQAEIIVEQELGQFKLQVRAKPLNYQQLFYPAALVFVLDGEIAQNQLFAPPENCKRYGINIKERALHPNDTFLELQFELKGCSNRLRVSLSAAVTRATTDTQTARVNNGSALTVWPNFKRTGCEEPRSDSDPVRHGAWRDYFVHFATSDGNINLKSMRLVGEGVGRDVSFDGSTPKGAVGFPPDYIEIVADVNRGGGQSRPYNACFDVKLDSYTPKTNTLSKKLRVAIDFGTSNTCLYYVVPTGAGQGNAAGTSGDPKLLKLSNKTHEVVRGLQLGASLSHTWLPDMKGQELIPSELVFRIEPQNLLAQNPAPIVDYTIPPLRWRAGEEKLICTGFKWEQSTEPSAVRGQFRDLQRMYLDLLFRMALADLVAGGPLSGTDVHPNEIDLVYTYPLAMTEERRRGLRDVFEFVAGQLRERTGITLNVTTSIDESRAGETGVGAQDPGQRIYVDIGGGTTDLAVIEQRQDVAGRELLLVDSMRYAGNDFLTALSDDDRGGHIATRPLIELQRRVRAAKDGRALEDLNVFGNSEERKEEAQQSLERFLRGLTQYLARIIALRVKGLGEDAVQHTLHIFLLGNGWRFILFLPRDPLADPKTNPKDIIREAVSQRLKKELELFQKAGIIAVEPNFELLHPEDPKTVVARGALEATRLPLEGLQQTFMGSDVKAVTPTGAVPLRWDTILPHNLGAVINRVSFYGRGLAGFEEIRVPDYQFDHAPLTDLQDVDISRYVADRGQILASAFNVYLERWYKNYLTGSWAKKPRGER